jgi:hypothetical protein
VRLIIRLPADAQHVNIQIVKGGLMADPSPTPKPVEQEGSPILCPQCMRRSNYLFNVDLYACPVGHGVVITGEELASYFRDALR